jgi:hypothetical protein
MILKIFKVVWFVSLLAMVGAFVYSYASWPEVVGLGEEASAYSLHKGMLFYLCLGLAGIFNAVVFVIPRFQFSEAFAAWFYGLVISFHAFFISVFIFITIFNSAENYDYAQVGPILYASTGLLLVWMAAWPVYLIMIKFMTQPRVG